MEIRNKINLGSGTDYREGWVNVDISDNVYSNPIKLDVKWNLNKFPYPFEEDTFDEVLIKSVLEYLDNPVKALQEVVRIAKNKAKITIFVIHVKSYAGLSQITFKVNFTENSFAEARLLDYGLGELRLINREFIFSYWWKKYIPFKKFFIIFFAGLYDKIKFEFEVNKT